MTDSKVIAIGCDHGGFRLKATVLEVVGELGYQVEDVGTHSSESVDYPDFAHRVAELVSSGQVQCGILICGTGIGMAISANKVKGIRATTAHDVYSVERSVLSNNCQVLTLGARVVAPELAWTLVDRWLDLEFDDSSPSAAKVQIITDYDESGTSS